jgi:hypothetical protein
MRREPPLRPALRLVIIQRWILWSPKAKAMRDKILGVSADKTLLAQSLFLSNAKK